MAIRNVTDCKGACTVAITKVTDCQGLYCGYKEGTDCQGPELWLKGL